MAATMEDLNRLAEEQAAAEVAVAEAELALDMAKKALADVSEVRLPEAMEELGLERFETSDGLKIKVTTKLRTSITERNRNDAFNWLRAHGHDSMIKRQLTVLAADDAQGEEIAKLLGDFDVSDKATVPWQTLDKFITEMLEDGEDIPQDVFGVWRQRKAKVTR